MAFNREYPYNDSGRMDTDWLISQVRELAEKLKDGVGYRLRLEDRVLTLLGNDGSVSKVTLPEGGGGGSSVTYRLTKTGDVITLRGSDGTTSDVTITHPTKLPNPHALHFTGASTAVYDGSSEVSVNIPTGGGVSHELSFSGAVTALFDNTEDIDVYIPPKLPNPQKLTFTGASTGQYDGSNALTINIPSGGGGGGIKTFTKLATIDCSVTSGNILLENLEGITDLYFSETHVQNAVNTASAYNLYINDIEVVDGAIPIENSTNRFYKWQYAHFDGFAWNFYALDGTGVYKLLRPNSYVRVPYYYLNNVGACNKLMLSAPIAQYEAVSGTIEIWGGK